MTSPPLLPIGTLLAGKYRIDGVLGQGGMGAVYLATNVAINRRVAVKLLHGTLADRSDLKRRFELEARAAAVIGHPGIVDVLDLGETADGAAFMVMEQLEGATLRAVFKRHGHLFTVEQAVAVLAPALDALAAAHLAHVIHRDVKPANIFLCTRPGRAVKLLDFGVSRFGRGTGLTVTGVAVGTPKYMAPEQLAGEKTIGPEADLYSVGAVLYLLLAGVPPHDADSELSVLQQRLAAAPASLVSLDPSLPPALSELVDELLATEPQRRPHDAAQVAARLRAFAPNASADPLWAVAAQLLSEGPQLAPPKVTRRGSRATPAARAPRVPLWAVLLGVAVLFAGGFATARLLFAPAAAPPPPPSVTPPPAPPAPVAPPPVRLSVAVTPPDAQLEFDGVVQGCNPCAVTYRPGARVHLRASAPGHQPLERDVLVTVDEAQHLALAPLPEAPAAQPPPAPVLPPVKKVTPSLNVNEHNPYQ
jgi:serine/threonine-protein kinase